MFSILARWVAMTLAVLITAYVFKGSITVQNPQSAFLVAVVLSLLNVFLRPILILLTLPFNLITLGLFTLVINAFLLWLTSQLLHGAFTVSGIMPAILGSITISILSGLINWMLKPGKKEDDR